MAADYGGSLPALKRKMLYLHSYRMASIGFIRAALRAGMRLATRATHPRTADTAANVVGSTGLTP